MKENELRRGNFVLLKDSAIICQIHNISVQMDVLTYPEEIMLCKYPLISFEPIPLTSDLLKKCSLIPVGEVMYFAKDFWFRFLNNQLALLDDSKFPFPGFLPLRYVHELQNLYFALTGKELPVNF